MKPTWRGYYDQRSQYVVGDVVVLGSHVYMAKSLVALSPPTLYREGSGDWIHLGHQENCKIDHYYHAEGIEVPLPSGKMSDTAYICSDCWKNNNFAAAFMPDEHAYLIAELP